MAGESVIPVGAIVITPEMMYATLTDVVKKVDHIETLLNPALNEIRNDVKNNKTEIDRSMIDHKVEVGKALVEHKVELSKTTDDHESRIRSLEKMSWKIAGASGVISLLASLVVVWLGRK